MSEWEQFEAWIEKRILERRATRDEVYALRRLRRRDNQITRALLLRAYIIGTFQKPIAEHTARIVDAMRPVVENMNKLALLFAEAEADALEHTDLGEFDNRAHDWMRGDI